MKHLAQTPINLSVPFKDRIEAFAVTEHAGFDGLTLQDTELVSVCQESQNVRYAFTVQPALCNPRGTLHGGAATAIFDTLTSSALLAVARHGYWDWLGVSRNLTVTFLKPLPLGTRVLVDCAIVAVGKRMANLKGTMTTEDGSLCAICTHDKVAVEVPKL